MTNDAHPVIAAGLAHVPGVAQVVRAIRSVGPTAWSGIAALTGALLAVLLAAPMLRAPLSKYDGGIALSAGTFILHGAVPYRDFWLLYGPLAGYLSAAVTAIFGPNLTILRLAGLGLVAATAVLAYRLVRETAHGIPGIILATTAATIGVSWTGLDLWPWTLGMALVLAAIFVAQRNTNRNLVVAGLLLGLAVLARQDLGGYGLIAVAVATRSLRPFAGAAVVLVPAGVLLLLTVPVASLLQQLVWYPLVGPHQFRGSPAPSLVSFLNPDLTLSWILYWPPLVVIGAALFRFWRARSIPMTYGALLILALLCRLQMLGRADQVHSVEAILPVVLLLGFALSPPRRSFQRVTLSVGMAVLIALAAMPLMTLGSPPDPYDAALTTAANLVRGATRSTDPISVGEIRNRYTLQNPLIAYYLADRPPGVRATMYNPGVTNTASTRAQMAEDLRANRVRFLILDVSLADCFEPANESRVAGATILDQEISRDYEVVSDFGAVVVMGLRGTTTSLPAPTLWVDPAPPGWGNLSCPPSPAQ